MRRKKKSLRKQHKENWFKSKLQGETNKLNLSEQK